MMMHNGGKSILLLKFYNTTTFFLVLRMKKTLALTILLLMTTHLYAHKPVLNSNSSFPADAPYEIEEPEISKAIYSKLDGAPHYYRIDSDESFDFYGSVLAAKIDNCPLQKTFSFEVLDSDFHLIYLADGENFEWWPWFEEYGKQWYWVGPEIGANFASNEVFEAGTYYIKVFNQSNSGQYILAVGDIEGFSVKDIVNTLFSMGKIEKQYWDSSQCEID